jgi:acyl-homoserine lactone acylase PvdQ
VTAEDRIFQISFRRIFSQGRIAEFLGERGLQSDIMMREIGFNKLAKDITARLKKENQT